MFRHVPTSVLLAASRKFTENVRRARRKRCLEQEALEKLTHVYIYIHIHMVMCMILHAAACVYKHIVDIVYGPSQQIVYL